MDPPLFAKRMKTIGHIWTNTVVLWYEIWYNK